MDSLRLILLVIGAVFIAIFYLVMRLKSGKPLRWPSLSWPDALRFGTSHRNDYPQHEADAVTGREAYYDEPDEDDIRTLSEMSLQSAAPEGEDIGVTGLSAVSEDATYDGEPLIIVLNIMAKPGQWFDGQNLLAALEANSMQHGEMMIFHRYSDTSAKQPVFSLANTVEPGNFNLDTIEQLQTPGLSLFMQLPGPIDSREAFELMLKTGRNLAQQLDGDLCDETRSVLTLQTIGHIKEKIEAFLFRQKMASLQKQRPKSGKKSR